MYEFSFSRRLSKWFFFHGVFQNGVFFTAFSEMGYLSQAPAIYRPEAVLLLNQFVMIFLLVLIS